VQSISASIEAVCRKTLQVGKLAKRHYATGVKYWEIIADRLSKAGWSWGCVSGLDSQWRTIWIADAPSTNSIQR